MLDAEDWTVPGFWRDRTRRGSDFGIAKTGMWSTVKQKGEIASELPPVELQSSWITWQEEM